MGYYTTITELPPLRIPGTRSGLIFRWSDSYTDKLYQLYINGKLAGETRSINAPKQLSAAAAGNIVWQVLAIDPASAGTDYSSYLDMTDSQGSRVEFSWPRDSVTLELGSYVNVFWDSATGTIDEDNQINGQPIYNFPPGAPRWGFGLGAFGDCFGYDGTGIGFGIGGFGEGAFGFGADDVVWTTKPMPPGTYKFTTIQYDARCNPDDGSAQEITVAVDCPPTAPQSIVVKTYVSETDVLTLTVTAGSMALPY